MDEYIIRNMTLNEVKNIAVKWAEQEGWNPGLHDAEAFYQTDPTGFYVGLLNDKPIACISIVKYNDSFAFLGFYIVQEAFRGKGYGLKLWNTAITHVQNQNIGLDGVVDQQHNYKKSNFKFAYNNVRYEGRTQKFTNLSEHIQTLEDKHFKEIIKFDKLYFPTDRALFLRNWLNQNERSSLVYCKDDTILGYATIRKCVNGYKIGPLFAKSNSIAEQLFQAVNNQANSEQYLYLDIPEPNKKAYDLVKKYSMQKVFETARMYNKTEPDICLSNIYGVTSFELG